MTRAAWFAVAVTAAVAAAVGAAVLPLEAQAQPLAHSPQSQPQTSQAQQPPQQQQQSSQAQQPPPQQPPAQPRGAVLADTVRIGDVVPIAVRVTAGPGERILLPDTLPLGGTDVENAARVRERADTLEGGGVQVAGLYSITPWRPGTVELPELMVRIAGADGTVRAEAVPLPSFEVGSVLPADAAVLEPMPAKGVIGPSFAWWPFALLLLALLALGLLAWRWIRRDRPAVAGPAVPAVPPRVRALAALDRAHAAGLIERGEWKEFYTRVSHALREYLEAVQPAWGEDLTTSELLARIRVDMGPDEAAALARLLRPADQVKFARRVPVADEARSEWEDARRWVERFDGPPRAAVVEAAA